MDGIVLHNGLPMEIEHFRIFEWTSTFKDGSRELTFELQARSATSPEKWERLGTSPTLGAARKALLFHAPKTGCGLC
jgi:hypothetical protein